MKRTTVLLLWALFLALFRWTLILAFWLAFGVLLLAYLSRSLSL